MQDWLSKDYPDRFSIEKSGLSDEIIAGAKSLIKINYSDCYLNKHVDLIEILSNEHSEYFLKCKAQYCSDSTFTEWIRPIGNLFVNNIFENIKDVSIPPNSGNSLSCVDGNSCSIQFSDYFEGQEFYWWMEVPDSWEFLENIADSINSQAGKCNNYDPF